MIGSNHMVFPRKGSPWPDGKVQANGEAKPNNTIDVFIREVRLSCMCEALFDLYSIAGDSALASPFLSRLNIRGPGC